MRALSFFCLACLFSITMESIAQIGYPGVPATSREDNIPALDITAEQTLPAVNVKALIEEDKVTDAHKDIPWRFGTPVDVKYDLTGSGQWNVLPGGEKVWRLKIVSPKAVSLNLNFDRFYLPEGASMYVYDPGKKQVLGAFTHLNNKPDSLFATFIIRGEALVIEYNEPAGVEFPGIISIGSVVHGYRGWDKAGTGFGDSGPCNIGINCPEGAGWQDEKRSVVMIMLANNSRVCTGTLVNNTLLDGTPYVLTANHCPINTNNIFAFNYDSPNCLPPGNPNTNKTIQGCVLRANNSSGNASDFNLVELSSVPPASYNVYYAGWSNLDQPSPASVCIHHPRGDTKKISFDYQFTESSGYYTTGDNHWAVLEWDTGTTEDASSGSPLFNDQHRVVGQLHGGEASCNNDTMDFFGKFSYSWETESDSARQLKYWLDPLKSGVNVLDGYDPARPVATLDALLAGFTNFKNTICEDSVFPHITLKNAGTITLTALQIVYSLDGLRDTINWTGSLASNKVTDIPLPAMYVSTGKHKFVAVCSNPNNGVDQNIANDVLRFNFFSVASPKQLKITLKTDNFGNETSWELRNAANTLIDLGGGYPGVNGGGTYIKSMCLYDGCYKFTIFDTFGDGFCCTQGNGFYLLTDADSGDTLDFNNSFSVKSHSFQFCVGDSCTILADPSIKPVSSASAADGSIMLKMIAGNPPFTYSWSTGAITKDLLNVAQGSYDVTITDSLDCTSTFTYEVPVSTGISSKGQDNPSMQVFPNPSKGIVNVRFAGSPLPAYVEIYDMLGHIVHNETVTANETNQIDISHLHKGIYFIRLYQEGRSVVSKVILN